MVRKNKTEKVTLQQCNSQKMESLGRLAGGVAHDFNNMLSGIKGAAEFVKMKMTEAEKQKFGKYIEMIIGAAGRSADLVAQLLVYSREKEKSLEAIDLNELVKNAVALLAYGVPKNIVIEQKIGAKNPVVEGDWNLVQNALLNLGFNAKDAMPDGGKIKICTKDAIIGLDQTEGFVIKPKPGKYVELSVKDQGKGISGEIRDKIFEPFFTTKEKGKGTGLGLAAVYDLVSDLQGTIKLESSGKGTVFHVYLPLSAKKCRRKAVRKEKHCKICAKMMIVDDENLLLELLGDIMRSLGAEVKAFDDPKKALEYYEKNQDFDIVMMDVLMPRLSGVGLYEKMAKINPEIKAVFMSGYRGDNDVEKVLDKNKNTRFIKKPYNISELEAVVLGLLNI